MKYYLLFAYFLLSLVTAQQQQQPMMSHDQVKNLGYNELVQNQEDLLKNNETVQATLEALVDKLKGKNDNPFSSSSSANEAIEMMKKFGDQTGNATQMKQIMEEIESNLQNSLKSDTSGEYCQSAQQYLKASEELLVKNEQNEDSTVKNNVKKAMNLYISCAQFKNGELNLELTNSKVGMKTVDLGSNSDVNITSGNNRIKIDQKMMKKLKEKTGTGDNSLIVTVTSSPKDQAGLSSSDTQNVVAKEVIKAEFKKKTTDGVEDITVGQLDDNTLEVEFQDKVNKAGNICARFENGNWVHSGEFKEDGEEFSNICLMNHASEYSIVSSVSNAAKFGIYTLVIMLCLLFL